MAENVKSSEFPLVYAVVPVFNRCDMTLNFLRQFPKITYPNKRVAICDDGSSDNTYVNIKMNFPDVDLSRGDGNLWWSGGTNVAAKRALDLGADYILTINDDCHMEPDFLTEMVRIAKQDPKYIVGCRLMHQTDHGRIWSIGTSPVFKGYDLFALNYAEQRWDDIKDKVPNPFPVATMCGNGVLIPRKVFEEIGFYDREHMPQYHADSDFVFRAARVGYKPVISTGSVLYNHILTEPLVTTRRGVIFAMKSDRYWKAVWFTLYRYGPFGKRIYLLLMQYVPFFVPRWAVKIYHWWKRKFAAPTPARVPA